MESSSIKRPSGRLTKMLPLRSIEAVKAVRRLQHAIPQELTRKQGKEWIVTGLRELFPEFKPTSSFDREIGALLGTDQSKIAIRVGIALDALANEASRTTGEPIHALIPWISTCVRRAESFRTDMNGHRHA